MKRSETYTWAFVLSLLTLCGCSDPSGADAIIDGDVLAQDASSPDAEVPQSGAFSLINYNVAGLPAPFSSGDPERGTPLISLLLNDYDVALVQEDFWYHDVLLESVGHSYQSEPSNPTQTVANLGDGLNRFSVFPFDEMTRFQWTDCNGRTDCASDCLAKKGFSFARHQISAGVEIDIYNLHNEAGRCPADYDVRRASTTQILDEIALRSAGRAVIVAGDFNLHSDNEDDAELLGQWDTAMRDVCTALDCENPTRIERTFLRDGDDVLLTPLDWGLDGPAFHHEDGEPLSDHPPQWSRIGWARVQ